MSLSSWRARWGALWLVGVLVLSACGSETSAPDGGSDASDSSDGDDSTGGRSNVDGGDDGNAGGASSGGSTQQGGAGGSDVDDGRPRIVVTSPETGTEFPTDQAQIEFEVRDADATGYSVRIGNAEAVSFDEAIDENESVTVPLTLALGVNRVTITVFDAAGASDDVTWVLIYRPIVVVRPSVIIQNPADGATFHRTDVELTFQVLQAAASGYSVQIGDGAADSVAREMAVGESVTVDLTLAEGENDVTITVVDSLGDADEETVTLLVDLVDAPVIAIASPTAGAVLTTNSAQVSGTITTERTLSKATYVLDSGASQQLALTPTQTGYGFDFALPVALGTHALTLSVEDDLGGVDQKTVSFSREIDTTAPVVDVTFPRDDHAVKTRRVLLKGSVADIAGVANVDVTVAIGSTVHDVTVGSNGKFSVWLDLEPGSNDYEIVAVNGTNKETRVERSVYFGQRLGAGGAFGGAIRAGRIYTWGRNNLGQSGLDYVSHESRTAYCDRTRPVNDPTLPWCKAISTTNIRALCDSSRGVGTEAATACRAAVDTKRTEVCAAAGAGAPTNCASTTTLTANLMTACEAAYGAGSGASDSCKKALVCEPTYDAGSPDRASCEETVVATPNVYPAPLPPYSATLVTSFSTTATPAAEQGVSFDSLGVDFVSLAFNQNAASALDSEGRIWSWGDGANGMLCLGDLPSDADENDRKIPHRVAEFGAPGTTVVAIARGFDNLIALRSDGSVWTCGNNSVGQIGDGTSGNLNHRVLPTQVQGLPSNVIQVMAASATSYALTSDGSVYAWGRNQYGNLGNGTSSTSTAASPVPAQVPGLTNVTVLANGRDHVLAARTDGTVFAWGLNASSQVGPGGGNVLSPIQVAGVSNAVAVFANGTQGFYEDPLGRLFGWGANGTTANLGIVATEDQPTPTEPVFGLSEVTDVAIGALHGYAMKGDRVYAWGWSFHGSLGIGPNAIHSWGYRTPILVKFAQ